MAQSRWALPALIAGAAAIGSAPIFVRYARDEGVGPSATAFYRLVFALPVLWTWMMIERRRAALRPPAGRDVFLLVGIGLFFAADLAFWHWSIYLTKVANATLLACLASTFAALAAWIFFRERASRLLVLGLVAALAGSGLLMSRSLSTGSRNLLGDTLGFIAALFYAGYLLGIGRMRARCTTATTMAWSGVGASLGLWVAALASRESLLPPTARGWLVVATLALVAQVGGQTLIAFALAHLSMAFSSVSLLVQPVVAAALAWILYGESLGVPQMAGGVLILAGIAMARRGGP